MLDFYKLHSQFQNFMVSRGYNIRERESLISPIFPTTFTVSGGPDLAYKFLQGDKSLMGNQIVNQPCVRHWDIDLTGDGKHLSFFNMFVADSIEGYSREDMMLHFYEFFTKVLNLDPSRFYASYFGGGEIKGTFFKPDNEIKRIWQSTGIIPSRIISFSGTNSMDAFVANHIEPVGGPRSELFYDLRANPEPIDSVDQFLNLEKEGKMIEFFTHVLYNVEVKAGNVYTFKKTKKDAVAAGFGPQRILRITDCVGNIGEISLFGDLKKCLGDIPEQFNKESMIVCDHIRGLVFLINDGVLGLHGRKNNSRKYLFRKYVKNFKTNFDKLPLKDKEDALNMLVESAIEMFGQVFPDFVKKKQLITEKFFEVYRKSDFELPDHEKIFLSLSRKSVV